MPDFREWLLAQKTTDDPSTTGITAADLVARFASWRTDAAWSTPDELHDLIHNRPARPWLCEAMTEVRDQYAALAA